MQGMVAYTASAVEVVDTRPFAPPVSPSVFALSPDSDVTDQAKIQEGEMLHRPLHVFSTTGRQLSSPTLSFAVPATLLPEEERVSLGASLLGLPVQHNYRLYLDGMLIYEGGRAAGRQKTPDLEWIRIPNDELIRPVMLYAARNVIEAEDEYAQPPALPPPLLGTKEYILLGIGAVVLFVFGRREYRGVKRYLRERSGRRFYRKRRYVPGVGV